MKNSGLSNLQKADNTKYKIRKQTAKMLFSYFHNKRPPQSLYEVTVYINGRFEISCLKKNEERV